MAEVSTERVRAVVEPQLAAHSLELYDVVFTGSTLRVLVDAPGGIDLDRVTDASRLVSDALDRADPIPSHYVLEVSSPGLERPLRTRDHFRQAVGTTVTVKTHAEVEGDRRIDGVLESADDAGIVVAGRRLAYGDVERARTTFTWGPADAPRRPARPKKTKTKAHAK